MFDVEGFILVGGRSSRMGHDKALLTLNGETFVHRLNRELSRIALRVRLVGSKINREPEGENVPDLHADWGALGGIHAALTACQADWAAIVACDLPFVTGDLLSRLAQIAAEAKEVFDAVVPVQDDLRPQPLCALYRRKPCLEKIEPLISAGEHTPRALLAAVRTRWVQFDALADLPWSKYLFLNVNTPEDYERARQTCGIMRSNQGRI